MIPITAQVCEYHWVTGVVAVAYDRQKRCAVLARVAGTPTLVVGWPPRLDGLESDKKKTGLAVSLCELGNRWVHTKRFLRHFPHLLYVPPPLSLPPLHLLTDIILLAFSVPVFLKASSATSVN